MRVMILLSCSLFWLLSCQSAKSPATQKTLTQAVQAFEQDNYEQALFLAEKVLAQDPHQPDALILKAQCKIKSKDRAAGLQLLEQLLQKHPTYHKALAYRSLLLAEDKKLDAALVDINAALKLAPNQPNYQSEKGIIYQQMGQHEKAIQSFSAIIEKHPKHESAYYFRAINKNKLNDKTGALADFDQAIQLHRDVPEMYSKRAFLQMDLNNYPAAIQDFSKVIVLAPEENQNNQIAIAFNNRGFARYKNQAFGQALDDINYSLQLFPENAYAYKNRALAHLAQGKNKEACHDLVLALQHKFTAQYGQEVVELRKKHCR